MSVALVAVPLVGVEWSHRAANACEQTSETPAGSSRYSIEWKWGEFAYVCDYTPVHAKRRVGLTDAFP